MNSLLLFGSIEWFFGIFFVVISLIKVALFRLFTCCRLAENGSPETAREAAARRARVHRQQTRRIGSSSGHSREGVSRFVNIIIFFPRRQTAGGV